MKCIKYDECAEGATSTPALAQTGRAFCAGGSLDELLSAQEDTTQLGAIYEGFLAVARCPLPTLACVQGAAVGAGMTLALACDVRLVAPEASFDTRFLQLGIHCGGGHTCGSVNRRVYTVRGTAAGVTVPQNGAGCKSGRFGGSVGGRGRG